MALTQSMCDSFKVELLEGNHNFDTAGTPDTFKIALFRDTASIVGTFGQATTNYSEMGADEVDNGNGYTTGGETLTISQAPTNDGAGTAAYIDFGDVVWLAATITASGALIYNSSQGNTAVAVLTFGGDKTSTAGDFTIQFPAAASGTAIIRIA